MEEKVVKINFFRKMWYSITNFEQYPIMAMEGTKRAIKYLMMLIAIVSIFMTIGSVLQMKTVVSNVAQYIHDNIPEIFYENGKLSVNSEETIVIDNVQYSGLDKIIINTLTENDEQKVQIEKDNQISGISVFFFNDEIILQSRTENNQEVKQTYKYDEFISGYTNGNIEKFDKVQLVDYLKSDKMSTFYRQYAITSFVSLFIANIIIGLIDALEIALLGLITSSMARIKIKFAAIYNMAIYSLTLPMILNIIYIVINYFTEFTITYFQVAYVTIAYIYLAAAIFILKDDVIRKLQEVEKLKQEQIKVRQEIEQEEKDKEEEKEDNKEDKKHDKKENDDNKGDEPEGLEA